MKNLSCPVGFAGDKVDHCVLSRVHYSSCKFLASPIMRDSGRRITLAAAWLAALTILLLTLRGGRRGIERHELLRYGATPATDSGLSINASAWEPGTWHRISHDEMLRLLTVGEKDYLPSPEGVVWPSCCCF